MNVPLRRTLSSTSSYSTEAPNNLNKNPGFFVLFNSPHPARCSNEENAFTDKNFIEEGDHSTANEAFSMIRNSDSMFSSDKKRDNAIVFASLKSLVDLDTSSKLFGSNDSSSSYYNPRASMSVKERSLSVSASVVPFGRHTFQLTEDTNINAMQKRFFYQPVSSGKKSLYKPIADLSLRNLRFVANIDMENDTRCKSFVGGMFDQTYAMKFAAMYGTYLDSEYEPTSLTSSSSSRGKEEEIREFWDKELLKGRSTVGDTLSNVYGFQRAECLSSKQAVNLFEVGCIIAELYLGKPLLSKADFIDVQDYGSLQRIAFSRTADMPLVLRRLVAELVGSDESARPTAKEILQACVLADYEKWHNYDLSELKSCGSEAGYVNFTTNEEIMPKFADKSVEKLKQKSAKKEEISSSFVFGERVERLSSSCAGLFPSYFNIAYRIIGELKTSRNGFEKVITFMRNISAINTIPLDGLNLMLKHLLVTIEDPEPFRSTCGEVDDSSSSSYSPKSSPLKSPDVLVLEYPILVDCLGSRLGIGGTEKLIIPKVLAFLNNFQSIRMLRYLLQSSLWNILIVRAGVKNFLRHFFPLLLTYLSAGILHNVFKLAEEGPFSDSGNLSLPQLLWTMAAPNQQNNNLTNQSGATSGSMFKNEWLQLCSLSNIKKVQGDAVVAISGLMDVESLGYGLCARYILPPLLSLVGIPHLAVALFTLKEDVFFTYERSLREADKIIINITSDDDTDDVFSQQSGEHIISYAEVSRIFAKLVIRLDVCRENLFRYDSMRIAKYLSFIRTILCYFSCASDDRPQINALTVSVDMTGESNYFSSEGLTQSEEELSEASPPVPEEGVKITDAEVELLESFTALCASCNPQNMFAVQTIINMSSQLGDLVVSELVLSKIFNGILSDLQALLLPTMKPPVVAALMEVVVLLNGLLPMLSPEIVLKDYLQPSKTTGCCLPQLLASIPLVASFALEDGINSQVLDYPNLDGYINAQRRHKFLTELCRLLVSSSMMVGVEACAEYVLPSVDIFFRNFISSFGLLNIESKTMLKAFELGAELFLPLAQLSGPEAFYTAVPNLNPRLEMWLVTVGSNLPATSPPLPAIIWPEVATEAPEEPEKKKGLLQWIATRRWISSSSSSASAAAPVVTQGSRSVLLWWNFF